MARIRSINPCAPKDEDVARLSLPARYVWAFIPCHADREGRLKDSAFTLKTEILPADDVDMEAVLAELAAAGLIIRYAANGRRYIQIRTFLRHQSPHTREVSSTIPAPSAKAETEHDLGGVTNLPECACHDDPVRPGSEAMSRSPSDPDPGSDSGSVSLPSLKPPDQTQAPARSNEGANGLTPPRAPYRPIPVGVVTPAFLDVYDAYPRKDAKLKAAVVFQDLAAGHLGGELALAAEIIAVFRGGMLRRHPYAGANEFRPTLERVLVERRWLDAQPAPDNEPPSAPTRAPNLPTDMDTRR